MSAELPLSDLRPNEWSCLCPKGIRAATCPKCHRCGAERPVSMAAMLSLTADSIVALDVFRRGCREHGNETAAMWSVLIWAASQRGR